MPGLKKKGPKHKRKKKSLQEIMNNPILTKEDERFKKMMEDAPVYKKHNGAFRQVK